MRYNRFIRPYDWNISNNSSNKPQSQTGWASTRYSPYRYPPSSPTPGTPLPTARLPHWVSAGLPYCQIVPWGSNPLTNSLEDPISGCLAL